MTPTETAAYGWLQQQGYAATDITFRATRNPDFLTADGKGWEVKRLGGRVTRFELRQVADLRQQGPTQVLFWQDGQVEPVATVPFSELPMPGWWNNISIHVVWQPRGAAPGSVHTPEEVDALVAQCLIEGRGKGRRHPLTEKVSALAEPSAA